MIISGRWLVERISGGNTIWSWSKSTRSFQSFAVERMFRSIGLETKEVIFDPALMKELEIGIGLAKLLRVGDLFCEFTLFSNSGFNVRRTESCRQVYLFDLSATLQPASMWDVLQFETEHNLHFADSCWFIKWRKKGDGIELIVALRRKEIILLPGPKINVFHEKSRGRVCSNQVVQSPCISSVWECCHSSSSTIEEMALELRRRSSAIEGLLLYLLWPIPFLSVWPQNLE